MFQRFHGCCAILFLSFMNWRDLTGRIESFNWMFDEIGGGEGRCTDVKGNFISRFSSIFVFRFVSRSETSFHSKI